MFLGPKQYRHRTKKKYLTFLDHISKIWRCVFQFWSILILTMYEGYGRPGIEFYLAEDSPWKDLTILLHTKNDFLDAANLNGVITQKILNRNKNPLVIF